MKTLFSVLVVSIAACGSIAAQQKESLPIGPGDLLHIQVYDNPDMEQHARVSDSGEVPVVLAGGVQVAGETPAAAAQSIEASLLRKRILLQPRVMVNVEEYATLKVSVMGEVRAPGAYIINTPRSVLDVLTLAGGANELADRKVLIKRQGTSEKVTYFISNSPDVAVDTAVVVNPGDSIIVPKAAVAFVLGDVSRPGGYTMTNNDGKLTVLELVARAGGTNHTSVPSRALLIRKTKDGDVRQSLPLDKLQKGKMADFALQPDDIIYVPFSYMKNFAINATGIAASAVSAAVYHF